MALGLLLLLTAPGADASSSAGQQFLCEGDPLEALAFNGAVDAADIPNSNANTVPGAFLVLPWPNVTLQLPPHQQRRRAQLLRWPLVVVGTRSGSPRLRPAARNCGALQLRAPRLGA
jgi:hypothetical protein